MMLLNPYALATGGGGGPTDPSFSSVVLLLHCNGTNGSTSFPDSSASAHTVTAHSSAQVATAQSKFGGASCGLTGGSDYLSVPSSADFDLLAGDYTIEAWIYPSLVSGFRYVWSNDGGSGALLFAIDSGTTIYHSIYGGSNITAACSVSTGTWYHLAVARDSGTTRIFLDGALLATSSTNLGSSVGTRGCSVGLDPVGGSYWNGYIDDVRLTKGVARYTAAFTPPSAQFPDS